MQKSGKNSRYLLIFILIVVSLVCVFYNYMSEKPVSVTLPQYSSIDFDFNNGDVKYYVTEYPSENCSYFTMRKVEAHGDVIVDSEQSFILYNGILYEISGDTFLELGSLDVSFLDHIGNLAFKKCRGKYTFDMSDDFVSSIKQLTGMFFDYQLSPEVLNVNVKGIRLQSYELVGNSNIMSVEYTSKIANLDIPSVRGKLAVYLEESNAESSYGDWSVPLDADDETKDKYANTDTIAYKVFGTHIIKITDVPAWFNVQNEEVASRAVDIVNSSTEEDVVSMLSYFDTMSDVDKKAMYMISYLDISGFNEILKGLLSSDDIISYTEELFGTSGSPSIVSDVDDDTQQVELEDDGIIICDKYYEHKLEPSEIANLFQLDLETDKSLIEAIDFYINYYTEVELCNTAKRIIKTELLYPKEAIYRIALLGYDIYNADYLRDYCDNSYIKFLEYYLGVETSILEEE